MNQKNLNYRAADREIAAFHRCKKPISGIRAARGTTKSTAAQMQIFADSLAMPPCADGVRRSSWLITRTSFRDLELSAVATYRERFEGVPGMLNISGREPWMAGIDMLLPDGTRVLSTWIFLAVAPDDYAKLGSMQFTGAYINELSDYTDPGIVAAVMGSCGRYPSRDSFSPEYLAAQDKKGEPAYPRRVLWDSNGPNYDHWMRKYEDEPPATWAFHIQQSPLVELDEEPAQGEFVEHKGKWYVPNPKCTYSFVQPLGFKYWLDLIPGAEDHYIQSRVLGGYSDSVSGKRVYSEYDDSMVSKQPLKASDYLGCHLIVGIDTSGNHPAAVVTANKDGALVVLDEIGEQNIAFEVFVDDYLVPLLASKYSEFEMSAVLDPSNPQSGIDKRTALGVVLKAGLPAMLAPTNFFGNRIESVKRWLNRRNGFVISSTCEILLAGFRGRYHYANVRGKPGVHKITPDKSTHYADYHDALQYASLGYDMRLANSDISPVKIKPSQRRAV